MPEALFPVWADGRLHPGGTPVVRADDEGFLVGLAVFDTVLYERRWLFFRDEHLRRLEAGARALEIPWPPPWDPATALEETAAALGERDAILRLTLTAGASGARSSLVVTPRTIVPPPAEGVRAWVASLRKGGDERLEAVKSTSRVRNVLARREAARHGAWEALLANPEGDLSEGTVTNLFVVAGGALRTPSTERGCLAGVTRDKLLASLAAEPVADARGRPLAVVVDRVEPRHVLEADEVLLTNTSGRVIGVLAVGGLAREVSGLPGATGAVARALRERMRAIEGADRARAERA